MQLSEMCFDMLYVECLKYIANNDINWVYLIGIILLTLFTGNIFKIHFIIKCFNELNL